MSMAACYQTETMAQVVALKLQLSDCTMLYQKQSLPEA